MIVDKEICNIPVTVYGNLERFSDTISKGRCRIFYKGANRNGTYITEEFAERLLSTIAYAPVKGIYESSGQDYTDHGMARNEGRIYGVVPENPNLSWEVHEDEDGVLRTYACVDVYIYTALYNEAKTILGKSQSMELYPKSIKGQYQIIDGRKYYVFNEASFLGLQVLGEEVEPCFEGAAFYSLYQDFKGLLYALKGTSEKEQNGGTKMINYKLSDDAKFSALWNLLNVNFTEDNEWRVDYDICAVYDTYAVVKNYEQGTWERIYYSKDDETDSISITNRERCYIMDVTEGEKGALETLHKMNGDTYEKLDESFTAKNDEITRLSEENSTLNQTNTTLTEENSGFSIKIQELTDSVGTLTTERDNVSSELETTKTEYANLATEIEGLRTFKADAENNAKQAVVRKYTDLLGSEVLETYSSNLGDYTAENLDKELAYQLVSSKSELFTHDPQQAYVPNGNDEKSGLEELLSHYKK